MYIALEPKKGAGPLRGRLDSSVATSRGQLYIGCQLGETETDTQLNGGQEKRGSPVVLYKYGSLTRGDSLRGLANE